MGRNFKTVRLGESRYYVTLPDYMAIAEARGKEGQLGYNILPTDGSFRIFGQIEIRRGDPIGGDLDRGHPIDHVQSTFLNKKITWEIYKTETGYFEATTPEQEISAMASSDKRNALDSMIAIISTLVVK